MAAIHGAKSFGEKSSVRTWLVGILKHKIIDLIRRASREQPLDLPDAETSLEDFDVLYKEDGHYVSIPAEWGDPEAALSERKFFETLERCRTTPGWGSHRLQTSQSAMAWRTAVKPC